jgi:beta-lactamase class D
MKTLIKFILILFPVILLGQRMNLSNVYTLNLDSIFTPKKGTLVIYNINLDSFYVYNKKRAEEYFPAESTVKILCSIAALEQ